MNKNMPMEYKEEILKLIENEFSECFGHVFHCKECAEIVGIHDGKCINPGCRRDATNDS